MDSSNHDQPPGVRRRSLASLWLVFVGIMGSIALANGVLYGVLPALMSNAVLSEVQQSNLQVADQIKVTRAYYSDSVVAKLRGLDAMRITWDHANDPYAIPLPATFVKDLSDRLEKRDTRIALISPWPWPHRAARKMDAFQTEAWTRLSNDPQGAYSSLDTLNGRRVLRVAVPDILTSESCVNCHNNDANSPRKGWKVGDVRAIMEVTKVVEPALEAAEARAHNITGMIFAGSSGLGLVACVLLALARRRWFEKTSADQRIRHLAYHDPMTGVVNRTRLIEMLQDKLKHADGDETLALHFIDIDRFKSINDTFGHSAGDQVIRTVASRLMAGANAGDLIGRFGGDEFVLVQWGASQEEAEARGQAIVGDMSYPVVFGDQSIRISVSIGTRVAPALLTEIEALLDTADLAVYQAKAAGRGRQVLFTEELREKIAERRQIEERLHRATDDDGFDIWFQPICHADTGAVWGFEALARLPACGGDPAISPDRFIPVAESMGLIPRIGAFVIRKAIARAADWPRHLVVSINLSALQFRPESGSAFNLLDVTRQALAGSGLDPAQLEFEITEGLYLNASDSVLADLSALKRMGVKISLDDFGTGYSTLTYLWKFPFDKLKIDASLVRAIREFDAHANTVLATVIQLGHALGMKVTAEGVETVVQVEFLKALGCDYFQGYYFGRPQPADLALIVASKSLAAPASTSDPDAFDRAIVA